MGLDRRNISHISVYFYGFEFEHGARIPKLKTLEADV